MEEGTTELGTDGNPYRDRGVMTKYRDVLEAALLDDSITVERRKSLRLSRDVLNNTIANLPD